MFQFLDNDGCSFSVDGLMLGWPVGSLYRVFELMDQSSLMDWVL